MKLIIAGSRRHDDYDTVVRHVDAWRELHSPNNDPFIVSGGAPGVDALGERYAEAHGLALRVFDADWKQYGKAAGPIRNRAMAAFADALIAFPLGVSRGTWNMIAAAQGLGLSVTVIKEDN